MLVVHWLAFGCCASRLLSHDLRLVISLLYLSFCVSSPFLSFPSHLLAPLFVSEDIPLLLEPRLWVALLTGLDCYRFSSIAVCLSYWPQLQITPFPLLAFHWRLFSYLQIVLPLLPCLTACCPRLHLLLIVPALLPALQCSLSFPFTFRSTSFSPSPHTW